MPTAPGTDRDRDCGGVRGDCQLVADETSLGSESTGTRRHGRIQVGLKWAEENVPDLGRSGVELVDAASELQVGGRFDQTRDHSGLIWRAARLPAQLVPEGVMVMPASSNTMATSMSKVPEPVAP